MNPDLAWFSYINACGLDKPVTSIQQELQRDIPVDKVVPVLVEEWGKAFEREVHWDADGDDQPAG